MTLRSSAPPGTEAADARGGKDKGSLVPQALDGARQMVGRRDGRWAEVRGGGCRENGNGADTGCEMAGAGISRERTPHLVLNLSASAPAGASCVRWQSPLRPTYVYEHARPQPWTVLRVLGLQGIEISHEQIHEPLRRLALSGLSLAWLARGVEQPNNFRCRLRVISRVSKMCGSR
jgi:hypothetical protein